MARGTMRSQQVGGDGTAPAQAHAAVRVRDLYKRFNGNAALSGASFEVPLGSILALLGPSGCGKTTSLRIIAGFERPDRGTVDIGGIVVASNGVSIPAEQRQVGMVFQDYALFPHMNVRQNVGFGLDARLSGGTRHRHGHHAHSGEHRGSRRAAWIARWLRDDPEHRARVDEVLEMVGLSGAGGRMPYELSGGEQQRVALARALAPNPSVVLLDEPFSNLDAALRTRVRADVKRILREAGCASVFVTHDQEEAFVVADQVSVMLAGRVEQTGEPGEVYANPASLAVAGFLGDANIIDGVADGATVDTALGRLPTREPVFGEVKVVIRPEAIWVRTDGAGTNPALVIDREFYGHHQVVLLEPRRGPVLRARMGPHVAMPIGLEAAVEVQGAVAAFPTG